MATFNHYEAGTFPRTHLLMPSLFTPAVQRDHAGRLVRVRADFQLCIGIQDLLDNANVADPAQIEAYQMYRYAQSLCRCVESY